MLMMMRYEQRQALEALELRIRTILPEEYQDSYEEVQPTSMGSVGLKYGKDGKVAWDEIWGSFCDLAMAGGPPHKGKLLLAASREEVEAEPELYRLVAEEICRGIEMVAIDLEATHSPIPGWVRVQCDDTATAGWLARAIVMENVSARYEGTALDLPAGPHYRLEKEIKNVITTVAKTGHYWFDHTWLSEQQKIGNLFDTIRAEFPVIQPAAPGHDFNAEADRSLRQVLSGRIQEAKGLKECCEARGRRC